jgi:hypothetical protein
MNRSLSVFSGELGLGYKQLWLGMVGLSNCRFHCVLLLSTGRLVLQQLPRHFVIPSKYEKTSRQVLQIDQPAPFQLSTPLHSACHERRQHGMV